MWKKLRHILQKCEKDHDFIIMHWGMSFELNSQLCPGYWARSEPQHARDFHMIFTKNYGMILSYMIELERQYMKVYLKKMIRVR